MLYCAAAFCVLLSMFGIFPSWVSCTAIFALPHYISDACTLEMITLKLVMATFEWKLLAAHNVLYVQHKCALRIQRPNAVMLRLVAPRVAKPCKLGLTLQRLCNFQVLCRAVRPLS